jgi:hypothetical protein
VYRQPTDLKGEMATVGAVLSWADRTDARPQPEPASAPPTVEIGEVAEMPGLQRQRGAPEALPPLPVQQAPAEAPSRDGGNGAGALPFQGTPGPVEFAVSDLSPEQRRDVETLAAVSPQAPVYEAQPGPPPPGPGVLSNVTADGEPVLPRPAHDDDVDDGLSGVGGEDLSEIPEHLRG